MSPNLDTHEDLPAALSGGDPRALARARERMRPQIAAWCRAIAGGRLDGVRLEDLVDDIFYDFALDCVTRLVDRRTMWGYLKLMTARRTRRLLQRLGRHEEFEPECQEHGSGQVETMDFAVDRHRLAECFEQLTPRARRVLELRFCSGLKDPAIGEHLSVSSQYVGRVRKKALASLRVCMESPDAVC